ncbi:MAG: MBL fold metallo-hydrolase [Gammaproteobacteria bacterium]|nr:MBL fold metallo-hydrolase [Gammaproteobacteria bacterium]
MKWRRSNILIAFIMGVLSANSIGLVFAGTGPAVSAVDASHTPKPSIGIGYEVVAGNVSVVKGLDGFAGGNVAVSSGADGLLIVDDMLQGFERKLEHIFSGLKKCAECGDLKYLINTHWHSDHTGTNEYFGGKAVVIAHETVRSLMAVEQHMKSFNKVVPATKHSGLPDITFTTKSSVYFNGEEIELIHFPKSHTSGDIVVYFKQSKVLHLGDLYFNGMFPFIDLEHGGNVKGMISSIEAVLKHYPADIKIIPGHGAVTDMMELQSFLQMLKETTKTVEESKMAGMSLQSVQKQGLNQRWASWEWDFISTETWIKLVYNSL